MALLADDAKDRAEQLLVATQRLTALIAAETQRIDQRLPPLEGEAAEEKNRLANAYRLELARIKHDRSLIDAAPPALLSALRESTAQLHDAVAAHELALHAVKIVTEGLVHAMAEEVVRQRSGTAGYSAGGAPAPPAGPNAALIDRSA